MTIYDGPPIVRADVSLHAPNIAAVVAALASSDLVENQWLPWHVRAANDDGIVYFSVSKRDRLVGQAILHDVDLRERVALVGYHLFREDDRGRSVGTVALTTLRDYALADLALRRLVVITGVENRASQRIAEKCGFVNGGAPREGPHLVLYELRAES